MATDLREGKLWNLLKIDLLSHPAHVKVFVNMCSKITLDLVYEFKRLSKSKFFFIIEQYLLSCFPRSSFSRLHCPVNWGCRIHQLHLCTVLRPLPRPSPMSILDRTLNYLMVRLQHWRFQKCRVLLHWYQVHFDSVW